MKIQHRRERLILFVLAILLIAVVLVSFMIGRYRVTLNEIGQLIAYGFSGGTGSFDPRIATVMINIRTPRVLIACLTGACLAVCGAAFQAVFRNPMASPEVLGASRGAAMGACIAILSGFGKGGIMGTAFVFSLAGVFLVLFIGSRIRGNQVLGLILGGIMIGSIFDAGVSFAKMVADSADQLPAITFWMIGSLNGVKFSDISYAIWPMAAGIIPIWLNRWKLNLLTMDEDEAASMGVNTKMTRYIVIVASTLATAACVSITGIIGWVGLVIPHIMRRLLGADNRYLIPGSMLGGALFLLATDNISRTLLATEIPIGILTAIAGAPFFIYLLSSRNRYER